MRQGEITSLQWSDVDLIAGFVSLSQTKNGERRAVPLVGPALHALKARVIQLNGESALVFPGTTNTGRPIDIRTPWETALRRASISNFRFHDLRHSAASYMAMSGASPLDIAGLLGHKTLQMVRRYSHLSSQHLSGVVAKMNQQVFGAT